jgi:hypothetical protein
MAAVKDNNGAVSPAASVGEATMKTIVSALVVLSVLASVAGPAAALSAKTFYEQQEHARN